MGHTPRTSAGRARGDNQTIGARGEDVAAAHLRADGCEILVRNWHCRWGEIDIVAAEPVDGSDGEGGGEHAGRRRLVFCEVKTRTGRGYGSPLESITFAKMQRLRRLAGHWLAAQGERAARSEWADLRIDAIGVVLDLRSGAEPEVNHVRAVG